MESMGIIWDDIGWRMWGKAVLMAGKAPEIKGRYVDTKNSQLIGTIGVEKNEWDTRAP